MSVIVATDNPPPPPDDEQLPIYNLAARLLLHVLNKQAGTTKN